MYIKRPWRQAAISQMALASKMKLCLQFFALVVRVAYGFAYLVYLLTLFDTLLLFWCFERYIALAHRSA